MIKTRFLTALVMGGVLLSPCSVLAIGRRSISCEAAQQGMTLSVTNGIGVDIRLACAGNIADAQVSDPSRVVVRKRGPQQLYIKPIGTINLPGNLHSSDGMTMLSVVTTTGDIYQFAIRTTSNSSYSFLDVGGSSNKKIPFTTAYKPRPLPPRLARVSPTDRLPSDRVNNPYPLVKQLPVVPQTSQPSVAFIEPEPQSQLPVASVAVPLPAQELDFTAHASPVPQPLASLSPDSKPMSSRAVDRAVQKQKPTLPFSSPNAVITTKPNSTPIAQANAIVRGLAQLRREKKVVYRDSFWLRVQDVVYLLRKGKSVEHASNQAGVPISKIKYLLTLGGDKSLAATES